MLSKNFDRRTPLIVAVAAISFASTSAQAQIYLGLDAGPNPDFVCLTGTSISVNASGSDCGGGGVLPSVFRVGSETSNASFDPTTGAVNFNSTNVQFNSSNVAFGGGTATFNNTVSFVGPSVTFDATADFNAAITTFGISNQGNIATSSITTGTATFSSSLTVGGSATINLGGNRVQGVAAGTAGTDAVNVAQLNAATSGITTSVTAIEAVNATQTAQIADIQAVNTAQDTRLTSVETVNTTQSTQISGLQSSVTTQASQITAIHALNTTQSNQISALQAASDLVEGRVDTLFDLRSSDRRDMKSGVASAMAMAQAPMPSEPGRVAYAVNGATFRGQYAVGGSLTYRLPGVRAFAVNAGFAYAGSKNNGARVGIAGEF